MRRPENLETGNRNGFKCNKLRHISRDCIRNFASRPQITRPPDIKFLASTKPVNQKKEIATFDKELEIEENLKSVTLITNPEQTATRVNTSVLSANIRSETILATAIVHIVDNKGQLQPCRMLTDSGSQSHFLSERTALRLGLPRKRINIPVIGINRGTTNIKHSVTIAIRSRINKFRTESTFSVIEHITEMLPSRVIAIEELSIPNNIPLADPKFNIPAEIDGLIGGELFLQLLCVEQIRLNHNTIALQKTQFGWILTEEPYHETIYSFEERKAEQHFVLNTTRDAQTGRYVVRLPIKDNVPALGESYSMAKRRFSIRTLHQLAIDEGKQFPPAARTLREDFYVNDLLTGANSREEVKLIRDELLQVCEKGGFKLRQWASNDQSLVDTLDDCTDTTHLRLDLNNTIKTLGIDWNPRHNKITYNIKNIDHKARVTKRNILSLTASLFDPLGLLGPIIIRANVLLQIIWELQLNWDESVLIDIHTKWTSFCRELELINKISVSRPLAVKGHVKLQLHGFCDASEQAYAHRVTDIQNVSNNIEWRHVPSLDNPADLVFRGLTTRELLHNDLWFYGPPWLRSDDPQWPESVLEPIDILETRPVVTLSSHTINEEIFETFSSYSKLKRIVAYILRFRYNSSRKEANKGNLSVFEIHWTKRCIVQVVQSSEFHHEIHALKNAGTRTGKTAPLNPFLDNDRLLRVGGPLSRANVRYDTRHPILIPKGSHIAKLIIEQHVKQFHAGIQATLNAVCQKFWIPQGTTLIRHILHKCIRCYRANPPDTKYKMSDLPASRVTYLRPFMQPGVDFCGPLFIKEKIYRNRNKIKVYLAIFVCFTTKAVHIEIVNDLTDAFISTLRRFFSRRGLPSDIYSNNATNFIGAKRKIKELYAFLNSQNTNDTITARLTNDGISWHTIPPRSPHFGGLWEAASLLTVINQIAAILNSRPITPLSSNPNDLHALTPGHFLIGENLTDNRTVVFTSKMARRKGTSFSNRQPSHPKGR
ncbi:uncharacterized protein LOC143187713 [Calliopsis andreniformis]|uniref:uncharacterized protein LOC143187713 n=1 Tax=Calliopsis andreniformis TaxID=337506 RepID=UPI003FCE61CC